MKRFIALLFAFCIFETYAQDNALASVSHYPSFGTMIDVRVEMFSSGIFFMTPGFAYVIPKAGQIKDPSFNEYTPNFIPVLQGNIKVMDKNGWRQSIIIGQLGLARSFELGYGISYSKKILLQMSTGYNNRWGMYGSFNIAIPFNLNKLRLIQR